MRMLPLVIGLAIAGPAAAAGAQAPSLWDREVDREGLHFHFGLGVGVGADDIIGLHHTMELGGTFRGGVTLALLHTFTQNRGIANGDDGPDLIGAWMAELKAPLYFADLVGKIAFGLGGEHDQSDGIRVIPGIGWAYGLDLHLPVGPRHGPTLGVTILHTLADGRHSVGVGLGLGWTLF